MASADRALTVPRAPDRAVLAATAWSFPRRSRQLRPALARQGICRWQGQEQSDCTQDNPAGLGKQIGRRFTQLGSALSVQAAVQPEQAESQIAELRGRADQMVCAGLESALFGLVFESIDWRES